MPPKKQLSAEQVADLTSWIEDGAAWPAVECRPTSAKPNPEYERLRKEHWAWQPLARCAAPRRCATRPGRAATSTASLWPGSKSRTCDPSAMPIS